MEQTLQHIFEKASLLMDKSIARLESELVKIRAGKATPTMLEGILVDYYGTHTPIQQISNISVADARTLLVQPWEKNMLHPIERAIQVANIGINPQNDGVVIRLNIPPLTEERRKDLVKKANNAGENAKISIRNGRREAIEEIKKLQKDGLSEDICKDKENAIQELTDKLIARIEKILQGKEKEIMSI